MRCLYYDLIWERVKGHKNNRRCVINDPLCQVHSSVSGDLYFHLKIVLFFYDFEKWGRPDMRMKTVITTGSDYWSAEWINRRCDGYFNWKESSNYLNLATEKRLLVSLPTDNKESLQKFINIKEYWSKFGNFLKRTVERERLFV